MTDRPVDASVLISEVEGHLLLQAAVSEGRAAAERLTGRLVWLTDTQREELEECFTQEYLALARRSWQHTARRGTELRAEYEYRYRALRRRLCTGWLLGAALCVAAALLTGVSV
ncbi:hypothetical protein [Streptomyces glomeratus]|uniref:Cytochrome C oxidase subunit I n=1 Tax=Streptomyces glomeratus TaxID=284452 RepID=A0ABP6LIK8_9ACTN|nr:hypothetical protein [Streptomyces glomeratus]MCF1509370.1 hypothetical protein [Streptomyces glomeratus]